MFSGEVLASATWVMVSCWLSLVDLRTQVYKVLASSPSATTDNPKVEAMGWQGPTAKWALLSETPT